MVFFERCVKSVSLIGDSVDRTAETQEFLLLWITRIYAILKLIFYEHFSFFEIPQKKNEVKILPDAKEKPVISLWGVFL